ncbi:MAG TPA: UvrD-helicase domain-containing protein, partial [Actinomycetota bacterium]|nr:UvrD-helicase domain-containing protein [Actinomycetota bacterium]
MPTNTLDSASDLDSVVLHEGGPLLVIGGPGSGKTPALERRYLHLAGRE